MTPEEIKAVIKAKKTTQAAIARTCTPPVDKSTVVHVINRRWVSSRVRQAVADAIGKPVEYVFPEILARKVR